MRHHILGLIPARGGSKRLPRKNIRPFHGRPLVAWTIEQAKRSRLLDHVVVTTDDEEIAEISREAGAEVPFLRPADLARDGSPTVDAVLHALCWFEERGMYFDILVLLEPTSPLRKDDDIDSAIRHFLDNLEGADSLVSVGEVRLENPYTMKGIANGYVRSFLGMKECDQKNDKDKVYFPYGVVYISKTDAVKRYKTFYQERTIPYFLDRWQNYEIDDAYDHLCVEAIYAFIERNKFIGRY